MSSAVRQPTHRCTRDAVATHLMTNMLAETERYLAKLRASAEAEAAEARGEACQMRTGAVLAPPLGHGRGRVRGSAVLQVIAVLMIVAFILFQPI